MNHIHGVLPENYLKQNTKNKKLQTIMMVISMICLMLSVLMAKAFATESEGKAPDAKKIWDKTCFTCHGDSDHIARNFLTVVDGKLQGPIHKETFITFLGNHYLSKTKADAVYAMLLSQATSKSRFEQECSSCHQNKAELVYKNLVLNNGILYSRKTGKPTYGFMETHEELKKEDVRFFMKELTLTGYEIYVPVENK